MKWIVFAGEAAIRSYSLQEMLTIFVLVAVLLACAAMILLVLVMLDRAAETLLDFIELRLKKGLHLLFFSWRVISGNPEPKASLKGPIDLFHRRIER